MPNSRSPALVAAHLQSVKGILANLSIEKLALQFAIVREDLQLVCSPHAWTNINERRRIKTALDAVILSLIHI